MCPQILRKTLLFKSVAILLMAAGALLQPCIAEQTRPNIVLILTDDQGFGDVGCHGHPRLKTPNMDKLGTKGVSFTDFLVSPTCAPTRCALLARPRAGNSMTWLPIPDRATISPHNIPRLCPN